MQHRTQEKITDYPNLRFASTHQEEIGQIPGKLIFVGEQKQDFVRISLLAYNEYDFLEVELSTIEEIAIYKKDYQNIWVNIDGLHDINRIQKVCDCFNLHPLVQEDILHTGHIPKFDVEDEYLFGVVKMLYLDKDKLKLHSEQLSIYFDGNLILTFQEVVGDVFEPVRNRIRKKIGRVHKKGMDYLYYCLLDVVVDNYNNIMQIFGYQIEELEDHILASSDTTVLTAINNYKLELNYFRKIIRPLRQGVLALNTSKTNLIDKKTQPFFNDLTDGVNRAHETVENYKGMLSEQLTVYSINVNNKLNDIVKVLTLFSAVFIPLTFIAGIYGTNFENIPELKYRHSYFIMLGVMVVVAASMLAYFKRKKWF